MTVTARKNRFETRDLQLKQELRVAIKQSIYRICVAFGDLLDNIGKHTTMSSLPVLTGLFCF